METPSDQQPEQTSPSDDNAFDQEAIDALLRDAVGDGAAQDAVGPSDETGQQQADTLPEVSHSVTGDDVATPANTADAGDVDDGQSTQQAPEPQQSKSEIDAPHDTGRELSGEEAADVQAAPDERESLATGPVQASPPQGAPPASSSLPADSTPFELPEFTEPTNLDIDPKRVTMLSDVNLRVKIELGRTRMLVEDVLKLSEGSVVELDKLAGDPVDVYINDRLVARGEVLVLNDSFCVRISEVLSRDPHRITA